MGTKVTRVKLKPNQIKPGCTPQNNPCNSQYASLGCSPSYVPQANMFYEYNTNIATSDPYAATSGPFATPYPHGASTTMLHAPPAPYDFGHNSCVAPIYPAVSVAPNNENCSCKTKRRDRDYDHEYNDENRITAAISIAPKEENCRCQNKCSDRDYDSEYSDHEHRHKKVPKFPPSNKVHYHIHEHIIRSGPPKTSCDEMDIFHRGLYHLDDEYPPPRCLRKRRVCY